MPPDNDSAANNGSSVARKRMLLAEVYVHKRRRKISDDLNPFEFEVFHIYELVDDVHTFIQPRLATNCNERNEVIDALNNVTGSDTPPLQRLIKKLIERRTKKIYEKGIKNEPVENASTVDSAPASDNDQHEPMDVCVAVMQTDEDARNADEQNAEAVASPDPSNTNISEADPSIDYTCGEIFTEQSDSDAADSPAPANEATLSDDFTQPPTGDSVENMPIVANHSASPNHPTSPHHPTSPSHSIIPKPEKSVPSGLAEPAPAPQMLRLRPVTSLMAEIRPQSPAIVTVARPKPADEPTIIQPRLSAKHDATRPLMVTEKSMGIRMVNGTLQKVRIIKAAPRMPDASSASAPANAQQQHFIRIQPSGAQNATVRISNGQLRCIPTIQVPSQPVTVQIQGQPVTVQIPSQSAQIVNSPKLRISRIQAGAEPSPADENKSAPSPPATNASNGQPALRISRIQSMCTSAASAPTVNVSNVPMRRTARIVSVCGPAPSPPLANGANAPRPRITRVQSIYESSTAKLFSRPATPAARIQVFGTSPSSPRVHIAAGAPIRRADSAQSANGSSPTKPNGTAARVLNGSITPRQPCNSIVSLAQLGVQCIAPKRITATPQIDHVYGCATKMYANAYKSPGQVPLQKPVDPAPLQKPPIVAAQKLAIRPAVAAGFAKPRPPMPSPTAVAAPKPAPAPATAPAPAPAPKLPGNDAVKADTAQLPASPAKEQPDEVNYDCLDLRCNICLYVNSSTAEFEDHMIFGHNCDHLCCKCHKVFQTAQLLIEHTAVGDCTQKMNADRPYICIISAPIILKGETDAGKGSSYQCKYCPCVFDNEKKYVQHAQRHASRFRCKLCPNKTALDKTAMRDHLQRVHSFKGIY